MLNMLSSIIDVLERDIGYVYIKAKQGMRIASRRVSSLREGHFWENSGIFGSVVFVVVMVMAGALHFDSVGRLPLKLCN